MKNVIMIAVIAFTLNYSYAVTPECMMSEFKYTSSNDSIVTSTFTIANLGCGSDAAAMQKKIAQTKGIKSCVVNASNGTAVVKYDAKKITQEEIITIIENCSLCHDKESKPFKVKGIN